MNRFRAFPQWRSTPRLVRGLRFALVPLVMLSSLLLAGLPAASASNASAAHSVPHPPATIRQTGLAQPAKLLEPLSPHPSGGKLLWRYQTRGAVKSSPAIVNGVVYVGSEDTSVYAIQASTGTLVWRYQARGPVRSSPTVVKGVVYVGSFDTSLYALQASTGKMLWRYLTRGIVYSSPAVVNGMVYVGSADGSVYALTAGPSSSGSATMG